MKMRARNRFCELVEQRLLDLGKLSRIHDLKDILDLVEEHDLLGAVDLGPVAEQAEYHLFRSVSGTEPGERRFFAYLFRQ